MRKRAKRWRSAALCACLMIAVMGSACAGETATRIDASGQWVYALAEDGATITGYGQEKPKGALVIPGTVDGHAVTGIGDSAFYECAALTSVTIPAGVKSIGDDAFAMCYKLADVAIPDGVARIGDGAFTYSGLRSVVIPQSVMSIGINPFEYCHLQSIDVSPENPNYMAVDGVLFDRERNALMAYPTFRAGKYAIPEGTLRIDDLAFYSCRLSGVTIPESVTHIGASAFNGSDVESVVIPEGVTSIGECVFAFCERLIDVTIPASLTDIGMNPFLSSAPVSVRVSPENPTYAVVDGSLINKVQGTLISYFEAKGSVYLLPEEITRIESHAFTLSPVTGVIIPEGVTSIDYAAFYECHSLAEASIPGSVTYIAEHAFDSCPVTLIVVEGSVGEEYAKAHDIPFRYPAN